MKKTIVSLIFVLCASFAYGQGFLYEEYKVFNGDGYTYICDPQAGGYVNLYNKENKWVETCPVNKKTGRSLEFGTNTFFYDPNMSGTIRSVVNKAFTTEQIEMVKDYRFTIIMGLNSETGKLEEAYFSFYYRSPYSKIPVSVYRKIELELKAKVKFKPTEEGKALDYIYFAPSFVPKHE